MKESVYSYGNNYQKSQANKFHNRNINHWKNRIDLAFKLVAKYDKKTLTNENKAEIVIADIGCSIGTFAIEFGKLGYKSFGIDFDPAAIQIAKNLAKAENICATFINSDLSQWNDLSLPKIDIAICFDIFEHLHDDELGSLLTSLKKNLSADGKLYFHTFPTEYDYLFYYEGVMALIFFPWLRRLPLWLLKKLPEEKFERFVKIYALFFDFLSLLKHGKTHKESIKNNKHCNPLTKKRLEEILVRAGFQIITLESCQLYAFKKKVHNQFSHQPISHRNIFGVAKADIP